MQKSVRLFLRDQKLSAGRELFIKDDDLHYIKNVMRLCVNDDILIFNGMDGLWRSKILEISKKFARLSTQSKEQEQPASLKEKLILAFSPLKNTNTKLVIQKATELGVDSFVIISMKRSISNAPSMNKLELIVKEASEQCERLSVPDINFIAGIDNFIEFFESLNNCNILFCNEHETSKKLNDAVKRKLQQCQKSQYHNIILIGPEGGFSNAEREALLLSKSVISVRLNEFILRAETAAIAAVAIYKSVA